MSSDGIGFVEAVVIDVSDLAAAEAFWSALTGSAFGPSVQDGFRRAALPSGLRLVLQRAPEAKAGKNRVHLDIETPDAEAACRRVEAMGGRVLRRVDNGRGGITVCADPDGNEFCLVPP